MAEMDNSLNSQLQLQMMQMQQARDTQMQQQQQFQMTQQQQLEQQRMLQQSMRMQMMQQAQDQPRFMQNPMSGFQGYSAMAGQSFAQGFGVSPSAWSNYINTAGPAATSLAGTSAGLLTSLGASFLSKEWMQHASHEQRSELAMNLGYGSMGAANAVVGGGIEIGTSALGLLSGFGLSKTLGFAAGFGAPLVGQVGAAYFNHASDQIKQQRQLVDYFQHESYKFVRPENANQRTGVGLGLDESQNYAKRVRNLNQVVGMSNSDFQSLTMDMVDSNLMTNTQDLQGFEKKLVQQIEYIRNSAKILNKTHKEITALMSDYKKLGIDSQNFDVEAARMKFTAVGMGVDVNTAIGITMANTQQRVAGTMLSGGTALAQSQYMSALAGNLYNQSETTGNKVVSNAIKSAGGVENMGGFILGLTDRMIGNDQMASSIAANMFKSNGKGGFDFDSGALTNLVKQARGGQLDFDTLINTGTKTMTGMNFEQQTQLMRTGKDLLRGREPYELNQLLEVLLKSNENRAKAYGVDAGTYLQNQYGMSNHEYTLLNAMVNQFSTQGDKIQAQIQTVPFFEATRAGQGLYVKSPWEQLKYGYENLMDNATQPMVSVADAMTRSFQTQYDRMSGINVSVADYKPLYSANQYDLSSKGARDIGRSTTLNIQDALGRRLAGEQGLSKRGLGEDLLVRITQEQAKQPITWAEKSKATTDYYLSNQKMKEQGIEPVRITDRPTNQAESEAYAAYQTAKAQGKEIINRMVPTEEVISGINDFYKKHGMPTSTIDPTTGKSVDKMILNSSKFKDLEGMAKKRQLGIDSAAMIEIYSVKNDPNASAREKSRAEYLLALNAGTGGPLMQAKQRVMEAANKLYEDDSQKGIDYARKVGMEGINVFTGQITDPNALIKSLTTESESRSKLRDETTSQVSAALYSQLGSLTKGEEGLMPGVLEAIKAGNLGYARNVTDTTEGKRIHDFLGSSQEIQVRDAHGSLKSYNLGDAFGIISESGDVVKSHQDFLKSVTDARDYLNVYEKSYENVKGLFGVTAWDTGAAWENAKAWVGNDSSKARINARNALIGSFQNFNTDLAANRNTIMGLLPEERTKEIDKMFVTSAKNYMDTSGAQINTKAFREVLDKAGVLSYVKDDIDKVVGQNLTPEEFAAIARKASEKAQQAQDTTQKSTRDVGDAVKEHADEMNKVLGAFQAETANMRETLRLLGMGTTHTGVRNYSGTSTTFQGEG